MSIRRYIFKTIDSIANSTEHNMNVKLRSRNRVSNDKMCSLFINTQNNNIDIMLIINNTN